MRDSKAPSIGVVTPATSVHDHGGEASDEASGDEAILDELVVEDVSIDGMCGVY